MFDAHAHLMDLPPLPHPAGVTGWIVPGVDLAGESRAATLEAADERVRAAVGLHPWYLPSTVDELKPRLRALEATIAVRRPCAIGETGLDKGRRGGAKDVQRAAFAAQVELAGRLGLPGEFADACAYLCSAQAGYVSGQNLQLDGGSYDGLI